MMQENWSLILNVLLLVGVMIAIARMMKARRQHQRPIETKPSIGRPSESPKVDDIIAVRKINREVLDTPFSPSPVLQPTAQPSIRSAQTVFQTPIASQEPFIQPSSAPEHWIEEEGRPAEMQAPQTSSLVIFLLAKEHRQLAGYELLQTVLAAGLRFGEGHLFHRHQSPNGQGPVLCSLAAATPSGVFDLQNIGAFSVHGLCLFMQTSGNSTIDADRFAIMLDTAKQLSEGLDTYILDDQRQVWSDASVQRYRRLLNRSEQAVSMEY